MLVAQMRYPILSPLNIQFLIAMEGTAIHLFHYGLSRLAFAELDEKLCYFSSGFFQKEFALFRVFKLFIWFSLR